mmetsp:Transcript_54746/g.146556  ORF Transcript_54746/g.146556 Transcript_54746/m.146556 type:complete len:214 (-) Transcript_54746:541-1182(-)
MHVLLPVRFIRRGSWRLLQQRPPAVGRAPDGVVALAERVVICDEGLVEGPIAVGVALAVVEDVWLPAAQLGVLVGPGLVPSDRVGGHEVVLPKRGHLVLQGRHAERVLLAQQALRLGPTVSVAAPVWQHGREVLHVQHPRRARGVMLDRLIKGDVGGVFTSRLEPGDKVGAEVVLLRKHLAGPYLGHVRVGRQRLVEHKVWVQDGHHCLLRLC